MKYTVRLQSITMEYQGKNSNHFCCIKSNWTKMYLPFTYHKTCTRKIGKSFIYKPPYSELSLNTTSYVIISPKKKKKYLFNILLNAD